MKARFLTSLPLAAGVAFAAWSLCAQDETTGAAAVQTPARLDAAAPADTTATEAPGKYDVDMALYIQKLRGVIDLLKGVTDKATADAAAPKVEALHNEALDIVDRVQADCEEDELLALLEGRYADVVSTEDELYDLADKLGAQEVPWFGSEALQALFDVSTDESPAAVELTPAAEKAYCAAAEELIEAEKEIEALLATVTDKESAEAAAPQIEAAVLKAHSVINAITSRSDYSDEVVDYIYSQYPEGDETMDRIMEQVSSLSQKEYYGSEALQNALMVLTD